jgi:hypothetical protein
MGSSLPGTKLQRIRPVRPSKRFQRIKGKVWGLTHSEINSDLVRDTVGSVSTWSLVFIPTHGTNKALHLVDAAHSLDLDRLCVDG